MRNKIQNIQDLEYSNNQILIGELIKKWLKAKPKNKEKTMYSGPSWFTNSMKDVY